MKKAIRFYEDEMSEMARFIAELEKLGMGYTVTRDNNSWLVRLSGGF